nr:hypothetical protein [uncultured Psychroserpens sp.]
MKRILHKNELVHPIFLGGFIGIGGFSVVSNLISVEFWKKDLYEILSAILIVLITYIVLNALNTSQVVALKNKKIVKGVYCAPFGFIKINNKINISDIKKIDMKQNEELFYEIIAESKDDNSLIIKSIANKIPALEELDKIKLEIDTFANNFYI